MLRDVSSPAPESVSKAAAEADSRSRRRAKFAMSPSVQAAHSLFCLELSGLDGNARDSDVDVLDLINNLNEQIETNDKGLATLGSQAATLDSLFHNLLQKAMVAGDPKRIDMWMKFALRAQSQCRNTYEAMSEIRNPRIANYVRQANVSAGHQQVNNGSDPCASAIDNANPPSKLSEGLPNDVCTNRATQTASPRASDASQTVAAIDGAEDQ